MAKKLPEEDLISVPEFGVADAVEKPGFFEYALPEFEEEAFVLREKVGLGRAVLLGVDLGKSSSESLILESKYESLKFDLLFTSIPDL